MDGQVLKLQEISHTKMKELDREKTLVAFTMSPMEVHGPHLPIGQDLMEAQALLEAAAEKLIVDRPGWSVLMLPPVPVAEDSLPHVGSIAMPPHVVADVAYYMLKPFAAAGFKRLAISSFHGGPRHMTALECAADRLTKKHNTQAVSLFSAVVARMGEGNVFHDAIKELLSKMGINITVDQFSKDMHAGLVETSLALHLWPHLVESGWEDLPPLYRETKEEEKIAFMGPGKEGIAGKAMEIMEMFSNLKGSVEHYTNNTYSGFPALSSAEIGKAIFEHLTDVSADILCEFIDSGTDIPHHTPLWKMRSLIMDRNFNLLLNDVLGIYRQRTSADKQESGVCGN